jgi:serine/threonine protein kinase
VGTSDANRTLGRYRVIAELGRGSTSIVYLAAVDGPAGFNKLFALKQLRPALAEDPALVAMFLAEARIGARLSHPNVVSTLEIDETERLPYIVMEYLDGQPLQNLVTSARVAFTPLPLHMHLAALSGALEGLGHAHDAIGPDGGPLGIVHRDVSPHNVFVTSSGMPKLLDFGFAQTTGAPNTMLSSAGRVAYWSPEQASGHPVDPRSDLFAVGVMLWEAATRRRFWSEEASKADIVRALASGELPPTRESALTRIPEDLRSLVVKATAPDPSDRYESAATFQADLHAVIRRVTPPNFGLRDLGQRLTTLFAVERARLQATIDGQRESAIASNAAGRVARATPRGEDANPVAATTPVAPTSPIAPPVETAPSEAARKVEAVNEDPLPSFPMPTVDGTGARSRPPVERTERMPGRRATAIGAIAVSILIGVGLSVLHIGAADRPQASASAGAVTAPPEATTGHTGVPDSLASAALLPGTRESSVVEAVPPSIPASPIASTAEAAPSEAPPLGPTPLVARIRAAGPAGLRPISVATAAAGSTKPIASGRSANEAAVRVSDGNASAARPSHPIDSTNPYP